MFCSISGSVPEQPVVSTKSGHVFEKRLVEKYVRETGKCPITSEPLTLDELLPLKASKTVKPRTAPSTSIPGLLSLFHDEWDALMLETHTLRQQLHTVRQELCHALYQHDAATRVIARLMRERDEARSALEQARETILAESAAGGGKRAGGDAATAEAAKRQRVQAIPEEVLQELQDVNQQLSKQRKKREISKTLATPDDLAQLSLQSSAPLHKTTQGGITQIELSPDSSSTVVATAGADASVQLFDWADSRIVASLEGHAKRVTGLQFVSPSVLLSSSADKTARIWRSADARGAGGFACAATLRDHTGEVVGVTLHPSRKFFVTASTDATWNFYDLESATLLRSVGEEAGVREAYTALRFHPDGLILGTATEACAIRIWEVKAQKNVATFGEHTKPVRALGFSENGYHLASAGDDGVKVWDLRKLKVLKSLTPYDDAGCHAAIFDHSGQYLGVGGGDARIYNVKQDWSVVRTFQDLPKKGVLSLQWGTDAKTLFVGAADHNLRVYGLPPA